MNMRLTKSVAMLLAQVLFPAASLPAARAHVWNNSVVLLHHPLGSIVNAFNALTKLTLAFLQWDTRQWTIPLHSSGFGQLSAPLLAVVKSCNRARPCAHLRCNLVPAHYCFR